MRQKRAKAYRKQMLVYEHTFKFREPYQVIVDDQIVLNCDKASFDLVKGLSRTIQAEVKPMITQCCIQELYKTRNESAIDLAKSFERRRCNHPPSDPIPPHECIKSIVNVNGENKHRYVIATENERLRYSLRKIPGVPIIYMNRSVMVMESLSIASAKISRNKEASKLTGGLNDVKSGLPSVKKAEKADSNEGENKPKKRKGTKEPNPLSVKKKKTIKPVNEKGNETSGDGAAPKKKRKRSHKKGNASEGEVINENTQEISEPSKSNETNEASASE